MKASILIVLLFTAFSAFAQRPLKYDNISKENEVYSMNKPNFSRVTVSAKSNLRPYFKSSDMRLTPVEIDTLGEKIYYHLHFEIRQQREKKTLEVNVSGFSPLDIPLILDENRWYRYNFYDPDSTIVDCYNQLTREGLNLFTSGMYKESREKYESAKYCDEVPVKNDIDEKLSAIDSILIWRNVGDTYSDVLDYSNAIQYYKKIYNLNPEDKYNSTKLFETQYKETERCTLAYTNAEGYYSEKDYENAKQLYKKVISLDCHNAANAIVRLQEIAKIEKLEKQLPHVLTYESSSNAPIGISTGSYKEHKASGYFTLRFNSDVFEALRSNIDDKAKPEINVSFGWTIKVVKPIWIFFGPGYTGVGEYVYDEEDIKKEDDPTLKVYSALSPELGLLGKIKLGKGIGIALRYTFQYRFALQKDTEEYIGKNKHIFGVGFCF